MSDELAEALGEIPVTDPIVETPVEEAAPQEEPQQEPSAEEKTPEEPVVEPEKAEAPQVPLAALLAERDTIKEMRSELQALRQQVQPAPQAPEMPDVFVDQEGFVGSLQSQFQDAVKNARADMSQALAESQHGKEAVAEALQALQASGDQTAIAALQDSATPYQELMTWNTRQSFLREVGDDPEAYRAKIAEEVRAQVQAELVAQQTQAQAQIKAPSLGAQPNLGSRSGPAFTPTDLSSILGD